jgi:methyltransferase (TIGR00027 family)
MALPNLSESMYVARLRYIQSVHELPPHRNPDTFVRHFIPVLHRLQAAWLPEQELIRLRAEPFYYFLLARTRHYDEVIRDAIGDGVKRLVGVGCGSDTRAYRFMSLLRSHDVRVLECDQASAIRAKERMARRWGPPDNVEYVAIDLNDEKWPELSTMLAGSPDSKTLVLMEGVSPYINEDTFERFLRLLAIALPPGSHVAYDFKIRGASDDFGRNDRTRRPFRLSAAQETVAAFHDALGFRLERMELSSALRARLLPGLDDAAAPIFNEDVLLQLRVK